MLVGIKTLKEVIVMTNNTNTNPYLVDFASQISMIVDQPIAPDHIYASTEGREYYIQAPLKGAPILLNHYRGAFCIDIHPDDLKKIQKGEISPSEYIRSSKWQIGFYWGGPSMVSGGYYQPCNIVEQQEKVQRYFKILSCRGHRCASGNMPTEAKCAACPVDNCPFSVYKTGDWESEFKEFDPRLKFFNALLERFEKEAPGYTLRGFLCTDCDDDQIILVPNGRYIESEPKSFVAYASKNTIRALLMRTVAPDDWDAYAGDFRFFLTKMWSGKYHELTPENIELVYEGNDHTVKQDDYSAFEDADTDDKPKGIIATIIAFLNNIIKKVFNLYR